MLSLTPGSVSHINRLPLSVSTPLTSAPPPEHTTHPLPLSGGGSGRAQQGRPAAGGAQNDAVPGEHFQPPGVHPGRPTVTLEHQAFHHLPGRRSTAESLSSGGKEFNPK